MYINAILKKIVDEKGIKQKRICELTGLSADCVSRILNSTRKITAEEFLSICEVLNLDTNDFRKPA